MKLIKKRTGIFVAAILVLSVGLLSLSRDEQNFQIAKNLDIYYTLFRELNLFYVDEVEPAELVETSINKMLESLDPYTTYIPEDEIEDFRFQTTGEYAGIGALIGQRDKKVLITEPYEGFPAQKAGVKAGDIILEVSGKLTEGLNSSDVSNLLKGPAKKPLTLKVERPGVKKPMTFELVREKIQIDPVPYYGMLDNETGYIRLSNFTMDCSENVKKALLELKEKNQIKALVLDLRSNPGGLLIEAVKITNFFVNKGAEIVSTKGKVKQGDQTYYATETPIDTLMPLAILVNSGSASASEILAGAIQDLDRGIVVGARTFGKGLVQTTRDLSYNAKLKVTTAKYYIPSGRCIQALDYTHRNEDGSVGQIPDSLVTQYSTKNGRLVYDGGGIIPDLKIESEYLSTLAYKLASDFVIFDYATQFVCENEKIASPEEFRITDEMYSGFVAFVKEKGFSYQSRTEEQLKELLETAKRERYYDANKSKFDLLAEELKHDVSQDLQTFSEDIKELLTDEIVSRYYHQKGAIKAAIKDDKGIERAVSLLKNNTEYAAIFTKGNVVKD
ncbi:MAG: peptidase S41 [Bacteroidetes bacterium GWF2_42_66]|nr:MAG: peptidase S41 [Bacteroidetes bacterium GWA2_42_15]OFY01879.1 MAG: peptidase S41 [Bacteroidetes bacterium GWE2_42_39]OFY44825.1 MAG: peptidase S41 [Bacteroidetes bacterium GWF2_42_66]HBL75951.1 peptidase S41 [Prolixibacteraceae bacterium]HCR89758.1 peptidase S41 [Prolixibacteraceae bacterium]